MIHSTPKSPKIQKINPTIGKNSKFIKNPAYLQRSTTEEGTRKIGNQMAFNKRQNFLNSAKEREVNININNNNIKKYSASFTAVSPESKTPEQPNNNQQINKSPNKDLKNRYSSENKGKPKGNSLRNKKKKLSTKFNGNIAKNIVQSNIIKELKEEDLNDIAEIQIKSPKRGSKVESADGDVEKNNNNKITKISISLSNEKEKANKVKIENKGYESNKISNKKVFKKTKVNINNNKDNKDNKENKDNKDNKIIKINNENNNNIPIGSPNLPKARKPAKSITCKQKIINPKMQTIKDFNSEDYNIIDMLGEGTFSQIFLVENGKTKEKFALKKLTATKVGYLEEKKEEFELILKLKNEEVKLNVVKVYGIQIKKLDKFNMVLYILMEAAKSDWETELKNRHYAKKYYNEEELKNILLSLVQTFSYLQKKGICHRDVKPQNILYFENGCYKITDFGEAKANKNKNVGKNCKFNFSQDTSVQTVRGTELYMSPILFDALRNSPGDDLQYNAFKSDVFSLGLCFLLAGSLSYKPLSELRNAHEMDKIQLLIEKHFKNRYSKKFVNILFSMLQLEEKNRPDFIELENMIKQNLFN